VFQYVSPSHKTILGYNPDEMAGRSLLEFLHPENVEAVKAEMERAAQTLMPGSIITCNRRFDDSYVWIEAFYKLLFDGDGNPAGAVLSGRDISHQKQAELDLQLGLDKLRQALQAITMALSSALEKRDPSTAGHQRRVAGLACAIAREMGLPGDRIEGIRIIAVLHDIGKIYVPSEILSKPGKLNKIEFEIVKTHSQVGYDILKTIDFPWPVAQSVLQHHERLDGSGYPAGIAGEDACLEARIIAIADVVEAMASHRPYRPAVGIDRALEEIVAGKGTLYDPQAVEACVNLFINRHYVLQAAESC
jgi:PAS domain S-box-containing protein/putative nucleotidyltransferase with HDIG domain